MRNQHHPQPYRVKEPLHFRGKAVTSPHSGAPSTLSAPSWGPGAAIPQTKRFISWKLGKQMSRCLKEKEEHLPRVGVVQNSLLRLNKGVCVDKRNRSRAREVAQKRTVPVMAKMCRRAHSAFKSLFGTRRRKESQTCGQGAKTRN